MGSRFEMNLEQIEKERKITHEKLISAAKRAKGAEKEKLISLISIDDIKNEDEGLPSGYSFSASIVLQKKMMRGLQKKYGHNFQSPLLDKTYARELASALGVLHVPRLFAAGKLKEVWVFVRGRLNTGGFVIKPAEGSGSSSVFRFSAGSIERVSKGELTRVHHALAVCEAYNKRTKSNNWVVEELVKAPMDVKFYCFYGKVVMIRQGLKHTGFAIFDQKLQMLSNDVFIEPYGSAWAWKDSDITIPRAYPKVIARMREVSSQIPLPFIRIDLLYDGSKFYFGEFTTLPGEFRKFSSVWNYRLGKEFSAAAGRLAIDIFNGKDFPPYREYLQRVGANFKEEERG